VSESTEGLKIHTIKKKREREGITSMKLEGPVEAVPFSVKALPKSLSRIEVEWDEPESPTFLSPVTSPASRSITSQFSEAIKTSERFEVLEPIFLLETSKTDAIFRIFSLLLLMET
jgi:hypothetical protein